MIFILVIIIEESLFSTIIVNIVVVELLYVCIQIRINFITLYLILFISLFRLTCQGRLYKVSLFSLYLLFTALTRFIISYK